MESPGSEKPSIFSSGRQFAIQVGGPRVYFYRARRAAQINHPHPENAATLEKLTAYATPPLTCGELSIIVEKSSGYSKHKLTERQYSGTAELHLKGRRIVRSIKENPEFQTHPWHSRSCFDRAVGAAWQRPNQSNSHRRQI